MISKEEIELYKILIPYLNIVFDVGCKNDTIFTDINPNLEIHLFDPYTHNPKANRFALGNEETYKKFYYRFGSFIPRGGKKCRGLHDYKWNVKIRRLSNYCREKNIYYIDYLKIDTEGFDLEVIRGASSILKNVKFLQFERFETYYNGETEKDIFEYLKEYNFTFYKLGGNPMNYLCINHDLLNEIEDLPNLNLDDKRHNI